MKRLAGHGLIAACLVTPTWPVNAQGQLFDQAFHIPVGNSPKDLDAGDVDGDGLLDVLVVDAQAVHVMLNQGPGAGSMILVETPQPWIDDPTANLCAVVACDLDGQGCLDAAVANGNGIAAVHNDCSTCTTACTVLPPVSAPRHLLCTDLDGIGEDDLVSSNPGSNNLAVLLNDGSGCFQPPKVFPAGGSPGGLAKGDLDQDGDEDVVVAVKGPSGVALLENFGAGTLGSPAVLPLPPGFAPEDVIVVDLNNDGALDLAACGSDGSNDEVVVFLGSAGGDGLPSFGPPAGFGVAGVGPLAIAGGDLDLDGDIDVATANAQSSSISVLLGDGDGSLGVSETIAVQPTPIGLVAGDLSGDGRLDLITVNGLSSSISVALGKSPGGLAILSLIHI